MCRRSVRKRQGRLEHRPSSNGARPEECQARISQWEERERPGPTAVWQTVGVMMIGFAVTAAVAALTISPNAAVSRRELWEVVATLLVWGVTCLLAHVDVNRGRRPRLYEVREVRGDE